MRYGIARLARTATACPTLAMAAMASCIAFPGALTQADAAAPAPACVPVARETASQPVDINECRIAESGRQSKSAEPCVNYHSSPLMSPCFCEGGMCHCCGSAGSK